MKQLVRLLVAVVLLTAPVVLPAQEGIGMRQQERILAKKAKADKKAAKVKAKEDRKRQLEIQDKAARKRLKRNFKEAERRGGGGGERRGFPGRLFSRRR